MSLNMYCKQPLRATVTREPLSNLIGPDFERSPGSRERSPGLELPYPVTCPAILTILLFLGSIASQASSVARLGFLGMVGAELAGQRVRCEVLNSVWGTAGPRQAKPPP